MTRLRLHNESEQMDLHIPFLLTIRTIYSLELDPSKFLGTGHLICKDGE